MKYYLKENWLSLVLTVISFGFGFIVWDQLPELLPTHWGIDGAPDRFSSKIYALCVLPLSAVGVSALLYFLLNRSPKGFEMENSKRSVGKVNLAIAVLFGTLHIGMILTVLKPENYNFELFFSVGVGLFLIILGNFISKVEKNFFVGVRTPWTLTSEKNWNATHRFAAKTMFSGGFLVLILAIFYTSLPLATLILLFSTLVPIAYSYWYFKTKKVES